MNQWGFSSSMPPFQGSEVFHDVVPGALPQALLFAAFQASGRTTHESSATDRASAWTTDQASTWIIDQALPRTRSGGGKSGGVADHRSNEATGA